MKDNPFHTVVRGRITGRLIPAVALFLTMGCPNRSFATPPGEYEYPELLVTPRASERLSLEAQREEQTRWLNYLPMQTSAAVTLIAAIAQSGSPDLGKDPGNKAPIAGIAVSAGWITTTLLLSALYQPYQSATHDLVASSGKSSSTREQLTRERLSEEAIDSAARLSRRLAWISLATELGASAYMISKARSGTFSLVADAVAMAVAFAPFVFPSRAQYVADDQRDYKKRIYAPVAGMSLIPRISSDGRPLELVPTLQLSMGF